MVGIHHLQTAPGFQRIANRALVMPDPGAGSAFVPAIRESCFSFAPAAGNVMAPCGRGESTRIQATTGRVMQNAESLTNAYSLFKPSPSLRVNDSGSDVCHSGESIGGFAGDSESK